MRADNWAQGQGLQVGFVFFKHGLHLAALSAVDTGGGPGDFPVFQKVVLLFDALKASALEGGGLGVADGVLDGAFAIGIPYPGAGHPQRRSA